MGRVHAEALRRLGTVEVVSVGGRDEAAYRKMLADASVKAVHICTPNAAHFPDGESRARGRQARAVREASGGIER